MTRTIDILIALSTAANITHLVEQKRTTMKAGKEALIAMEHKDIIKSIDARDYDFCSALNSRTIAGFVWFMDKVIAKVKAAHDSAKANDETIKQQREVVALENEAETVEQLIAVVETINHVFEGDIDADLHELFAERRALEKQLPKAKRMAVTGEIVEKAMLMLLEWQAEHKAEAAEEVDEQEERADSAEAIALQDEINTLRNGLNEINRMRHGLQTKAITMRDTKARAETLITIHSNHISTLVSDDTEKVHATTYMRRVKSLYRSINGCLIGLGRAAELQQAHIDALLLELDELLNPTPEEALEELEPLAGEAALDLDKLGDIASRMADKEILELIESAFTDQAAALERGDHECATLCPLIVGVLVANLGDDTRKRVTARMSNSHDQMAELDDAVSAELDDLNGGKL